MDYSDYIIDKDVLKEEIEKTQQRLNYMMKVFYHTDYKKILELSQKLDRLLNMYESLKAPVR